MMFEKKKKKLKQTIDENIIEISTSKCEVLSGPTSLLECEVPDPFFFFLICDTSQCEVTNFIFIFLKFIGTSHVTCKLY